MGRIVRMRIIGKGLCIYEYGWMVKMERGGGIKFVGI